MLSRRPRKGYGAPRSWCPAMGKAWVKARRHDRFYRAAKKQAYRSRAAIKLSQIDRRIGLFQEGDMVVDLGASPGGWSQVARERVGRLLGEQRRVVRRRGRPDLGCRAGDRSRFLQAPLRFLAVSEPGEDLAAVQPRGDVGGPEARRLLVAAARFLELIHPSEHD